MLDLSQVNITEMRELIKLPNPLTPESVENLIESFKAGQTLNVTYVEQILEQSMDLMQKLPNVKRITIEPDVEPSTQTF